MQPLVDFLVTTYTADMGHWIACKWYWVPVFMVWFLLKWCVIVLPVRLCLGAIGIGWGKSSSKKD